MYIEVPLSVEFKHCFHIGDSLLLQTHAHSINTGVRGKFTVVAKQAISAVVEGLQQEMTEAKSSTKVTVSPIAPSDCLQGKASLAVIYTLGDLSAH